MPDLLGTSKWEVGHVGSPLSDQAADLKAIFILVLVVKRSEVQRGMGPRAAHAAQQSEFGHQVLHSSPTHYGVAVRETQKRIRLAAQLFGNGRSMAYLSSLEPLACR